jgi:hypothetical protein
MLAGQRDNGAKEAEKSWRTKKQNGGEGFGHEEEEKKKRRE